MTAVPASHKRAILAESGQPPGRHETVPGQGAARPTRAEAPPRSAAEVLADRIAATLAHREPGWRLPRYTAMARRYHVSTAEIVAAIGELAARHLIRRLPDGQVYRASPAEYLIPLEGVPGLASHVDPMGAELTCRSRQVSWRQVPGDIAWALRIPPSEPACVIRLRWTMNGEPAASTVTYLPAGLTGPIAAAYPAEGGPPEPEIGPVTGLNLPLTAPPEQPDEQRRPGPGRPARRAAFRAAATAGRGGQEPAAGPWPASGHGRRAVRRPGDRAAGRADLRRHPARPVPDRGRVG
jgi:hypothetical protein